MPRLSKERQNEIDRIIASVVMTTGKTYPDDGLIDIVSSYGVGVIDFDFGKDSARIMGAIKFPEPDKGIKRPLVLVNKDKPDTNKTFTLAHEFGHFKLKHAEEGSKFRLDYDFSTSEEDLTHETEANYFAGSLLMPKDKLLDIVATTSDLNEVAKYFGVSRKALDVRLQWISQN
jgi:Zn-dependent peptidase ImmA (M78 family)